jgi:hypothetical protein
MRTCFRKRVSLNAAIFTGARYGSPCSDYRLKLEWVSEVGGRYDYDASLVCADLRAEILEL